MRLARSLKPIEMCLGLASTVLQVKLLFPAVGLQARSRACWEERTLFLLNQLYAESTPSDICTEPQSSLHLPFYLLCCFSRILSCCMSGSRICTSSKVDLSRRLLLVSRHDESILHLARPPNSRCVLSHLTEGNKYSSMATYTSVSCSLYL